MSTALSQNTIIDGDSRTDGTSLCTGIGSSLQSAAHNSRNNDSKSEQLYHPHFKQGQHLELTTKTADHRNNSSCDVMFCLGQDVTDHSFSSYRKSLELFNGYILPQTRTYTLKSPTLMTNQMLLTHPQLLQKNLHQSRKSAQFKQS